MQFLFIVHVQERSCRTMYMFMNAVVVQCTCFITELVCNVYFQDNSQCFYFGMEQLYIQYNIHVLERSSCTMYMLRNGVVVQCTFIGTEQLQNVHIQERSSFTMYMFRNGVVVHNEVEDLENLGDYLRLVQDAKYFHDIFLFLINFS